MKNSVKDFLNNSIKYGPLFKKRLKKIKKYHSLDVEEIRDLENFKLVSVVQEAYNKSPFYKKLYDEHGVNISQIQSKIDLKDLPTITKTDILHQVDKLYIGNRFFKHTSYTSGTTGSPLKVFYGIDCVINEASYNEVFRNMAGHFYGQKIISLRGKLEGDIMEYYDKYNNILYLSSYHIKLSNAKWYYDRIKNFSPNSILGYPNSLEALSNILLKLNLKVNIPLCFTSSEKLYPHQKTKIEEVLNTKVYDRYGNAERTISLVQYSYNGDYSFPPLYSVNEFISNKIFTTNLINPQFPLIRYEVNDNLTFSNYNKVKSIRGREGDSLFTKDGRSIGSAAISLAFKKIPNILTSQIFQSKLDSIIVKCVVSENFSIKDKILLVEEMKKKIGIDTLIEVEIITADRIKRTDNNKFQFIFNTLSHNE